MKHLVGMVATLATLMIVLGHARPAQAAPVREYYVAVNLSETLQHWYWIDEVDGIIGCPRCVWLVDLETTVVLPSAQKLAVLRGIMSGLKMLSDASVAETAELAAALRSEAQVQFELAARALGTAGLRTGVIGFFDPSTGAKVTSYRSWLAAADQDIADGIALFQRALVTGPDPQPWFTAGMAKFDQAYAKLRSKR